MSTVDLLTFQTEHAYRWVDKLIEEVPTDRWSDTPTGVETNVSWQVGHLTLSYYYHTIMVIRGHQSDLLQTLPVALYDKLFNYRKGSPVEAARAIDPKDLQQHQLIMRQRSLDIIASVKEAELELPLEPVGPTHPIASTKFEAIDWNVKHTMWHCGQLALLRRVLIGGYDFGLQPSG